MKISKFVEIVNCGLEPEIHYRGNTYWAAYNGDDTNEKIFYETGSNDVVVFYKAEELLDKEYHGLKIRNMIENLDENDIDY